MHPDSGDPIAEKGEGGGGESGDSGRQVRERGGVEEGVG
jgi:hypothetical protein